MDVRSRINAMSSSRILPATPYAPVCRTSPPPCPSPPRPPIPAKGASARPVSPARTSAGLASNHRKTTGIGGVVSARLRDERLAWLAVRDELVRTERRRIRSRIAAFLGGRNLAAARERIAGPRGRARREQAVGDVEVPLSSTYMVRSSLAVEEVAGRLSEQERATLRATGQVPDWFLGAVKATARHIA